MYLDKFQEYQLVGPVRELIRDGEPLQAICRLAARYPSNHSTYDAILAAAVRDIADYYADQTLNPDSNGNA